jgi:hypothetical protein
MHVSGITTFEARARSIDYQKAELEQPCPQTSQNASRRRFEPVWLVRREFGHRGLALDSADLHILIFEPSPFEGFVIDGHAIIGPIFSRRNASGPADPTEAATSVRKADACCVDIASVVLQRVRGEHLFFDSGSNKLREIPSVRFPPEISFVRESNSRDSGIFMHPKRARRSLRRGNE